MLSLSNASKICYGTLSLSPLQCSYSLKEKLELMLYAYQKNINFYDTAELYDNYDIFRQFFPIVGRQNIILSTKSYAYSKETAEKSINKALKETKTEYIDLFMLHEQESIHTFRGHYQAIERLLKYKEEGIIGAIGISTHYIKALRDLYMMDEIDVIHPIFNYKGIGIVDGTIEEMSIYIKKAKESNKKILAMKPFAGGHLTIDPVKSLKFSFSSDLVDWTAVGMRYKEEIDFNLSILNKKAPEEELLYKISKKPRKLSIADWCTGCGACTARCQQGALKIENGKCKVDQDKCVLCSYCASVCMDFCIKII
jgi:aryl-alcohol dehydrogenase-like predicted oxidoreductase